MDWIKNLKINEKLYVLIAIATFFIVITIVLGLVFNNKAKDSLASLYEEQLLPIQQLGLMRVHANANTTNLVSMILESNPQKLQEYKEDVSRRIELSNQLFLEYKKVEDNPEELKMLEELEQVRNQ